LRASLSLRDPAAAVSRHPWLLAAAASAGGLLLVVVLLMAPVGFRLFVAISLPVVVAAWTMPKTRERWLPGKDEDDNWPLRW
jgi:uncharacterized membrane protein YesL